MFDPQAITRVLGAYIDRTKRAGLTGVSAAQRHALVTLLGGPAKRMPSIGWIVRCAGPRFAIENTTMRFLFAAGLVDHGRDGLARLTTRGKWYAMTAAADEADRLMAVLVNQKWNHE